MSWVLILALLRYNNSALVTVEFSSAEECQRAAQVFKQQVESSETGQVVRAVCAQKGKKQS